MNKLYVKNGEIKLGWDHAVRILPDCRGLWIELGRAYHGVTGNPLPEMLRIVDVNRKAGMLCIIDDEGMWRGLVLAE